MDVRKAAAADVPSIEACARDAYALYVERIGREPAPMVADFAAQVHDAKAYVADADGQVLGFVVFYPEGDHILLENVAVLPEHQGRGIGRRLIAFVEQAARRSGFTAVELYTNEKMVENLGRYPKLGYVETSRRRVKGFARVFFRKEVR